MATIQSNISYSVTETLPQLEAHTNCCHLNGEESRSTSRLALTRERFLAAQSLQLLMRLDRELRHARADWNQDRFRRVMRARSKAVLRVRRRWRRLNPPPAVALGKLRRRYHANLAGYLYAAREAVIAILGNEDKNLKAEV